MDNEPDSDFRVFAAIELTAGIADMKIAQADGANYKVLERLRKRPPEALLNPPDSADDSVYGSICALLTGFERAARDYGAAPPTLVVNGLDVWNAMFTRIASELGMPLFMPDAQQCADMVAAAAHARAGGGAAGRALLLPLSTQTRFVTSDGLMSHVLPMGLDAGRYDYLMRADELERVRRKGSVDLCALMRDCARACARSLPVPEPGAYSLVICIDSEADELNEGDYTAKQLGRLTDNMARSLRLQGSEPGYVHAVSEPYHTACLRRALNGLLIADEIRAITGFGSARVVKVSALDAALDVLARNEQLERAGVDASLARRSVEYYARTRGSDPLQTERVRIAVRMFTKALARAFSDEEQAELNELTELAPVLVECFSSDDIVRPRDVARLPGLGTQRRKQLLAICEACLERNNTAIYSRLTPDQSLTRERDEEALFSADIVEADEFANPDEDDDDADVESGVKADADLPSDEGELISAEQSDELASDVESDANLEGETQYAEDAASAEGIQISVDESDIGDEYAVQSETNKSAEIAQPYYALRLQGMASTGMREYAEMFGGDERSDDTPTLEHVQMEPAHAEHDVSPVLMRARDLPLQLRVAAILMLARALSAGGAERLGQISAKLSERGLVVRASARDGATLESLEFRYRAELIKKVFGIKARLKLDKRGKSPKQRHQGPARHNTEHRASKGSI